MSTETFLIPVMGNSFQFRAQTKIVITYKCKTQKLDDAYLMAT